MSCSTHAGLSVPFMTCMSCAPRRPSSFFPPPIIPSSRATGVGNIRPVPPSPRIASVSEVPGFAFELAVFRDPLDFASPAVGVGQFTSVARLGRIGPSRPAAPPWFVPYWVAVGVGHREDEDAFSSVGGSDVGSVDPGDLHRVMAVVEPGSHCVQRPPKESTDVFDEDGSGSHLVDRAGELEPESAPSAGETATVTRLR